MTNFQELLEEERKRQEQKWGLQHHNDGLWMLILIEEVGEAGKAALEDGNLVNELVQVAAVAQAWAEQLMNDEKSDEEVIENG